MVKIMLVAMMVFTSSSVFAHRRYYRHINHYAYFRPMVTRVVVRPSVTTHISNRLSKGDRLEMALAYLKSNKSLDISKYSKMTGLSKTMAEAELDAFAASNSNPIKMVINGKKKLYVI